MSAEPAEVSVDESETVAELIDYGVTLRTLEEADLEALHDDLTLTARTDPSSAAAIRLALLLSYRGSPHYDLDRAINLLVRTARTRRAEDPVFRRFAELVSVMLIERRSLAIDRDLLSQARAADAERIEQSSERIELLEGRLQETEAELTAERARSERLQSQLNALIELEEQLTNGADDAQ